VVGGGEGAGGGGEEERQADELAAAAVPLWREERHGDEEWRVSRIWHVADVDCPRAHAARIWFSLFGARAPGA